MRKLAPLTEYLTRSNADRVELSCEAIETIVGPVLPRSARAHPAFWSNSPKNLYSYGWRDAGYRAGVAGCWPGAVVFFRGGVALARQSSAPAGAARRAEIAPPPKSIADSDIILIGCVGRKASHPAPAKDLYQSELFRRRRRYAESTGRPWAILSARHGLLDPDAVVEPYDVTLTEMRRAERLAWGQRVFNQLQDQFGLLAGKAFEIHAGSEYITPLRPLMAQAGAMLHAPLAGLRIGEQLHWYGAPTPGPPTAPRTPSVTSPTVPHGLAMQLTRAFVAGSLDFSARPGAPTQGWDGLPEAAAAAALQALGATPIDIRLFFTFCAAMDRARDADRLGARGVELFRRFPWCYQPGSVTTRPLRELADALRSYGVSQRHSVDSAAWRVIAESLADPTLAPAVHRAVFVGVGRADELLQELQATTSVGTPLFPLLAGPKIGPMWVRILAAPGGAEIAGIGSLPVAVDVQVRKVTEYLGVTETHGRPLEEVRDDIQGAWRADVSAGGAEGPENLRGTCAALDPALWYFAKWGCTFCERSGRRVPVHAICQGCLFDQLSRSSAGRRPVAGGMS